jgi:multiple sugar transport system substrate-binding protein
MQLFINLIHWEIKMKKTILSFLIIAILPLTLLFASSDKVKISFLSHTYEPWNVKLQEQADAFMKLNPNVEIEYSTVMHADLYTKVVSSLDAGTGANIIGAYGPWIKNLIVEGHLDKAPADVVMDIKKNFTKFGVESVTYDNNIYGYIQHIGMTAPIVNPDFFKTLGEKVPDTWADYEVLAKKYKKRNDITVTALAPNGQHIIFHWASILKSYGGQILSDDLKSVAFNNAIGKKATEIYTNLADVRFPETDANSIFIIGKAGMVLDGSWAKSFYNKAEIVKDYYTTVPPKGSQSRALGMYVWDWVVNKNATNAQKQASWDFIKYITNDSNYLDMAKSIGFVPFRKNNVAEMSKDKWVNGFTESLKYAFIYYPQISNWEEIESKISIQLERAVAGEISVEEALNKAEKSVNAVLQ